MRISHDARRCVVFFGKPSPPDGAIRYGGTGFLAGMVEEGFPFIYLITARHVAEALEDDFVIRANLKNGEPSEPMEIDQTPPWVFHSDPTVDLAAVHFSLPVDTFDFIANDLTKMIRLQKGTEIMCGDEVYVVGLWRLHAGSSRNTPIVHTGHVAAMADSLEKVPVTNRTTGQTVDCELYLVEVQTLEGLSGAPVFFREAMSLPFSLNGDAGNAKALAFAGVRLMGLYQGAWDGAPDSTLQAGLGLNDGLRVPVGMGLVVPGERIWELIMDDPKLKKLRSDHLAKRRAENAAKTDSAFGAAPRSSDVNPKHREEFNSLVDAAARKRKQDD